MQSGLRGVLNYPALPNPPHPIPTPCCKTDYLIDIIFFNFLLNIWLQNSLSWLVIAICLHFLKLMENATSFFAEKSFQDFLNFDIRYWND